MPSRDRRRPNRHMLFRGFLLFCLLFSQPPFRIFHGIQADGAEEGRARSRSNFVVIRYEQTILIVEHSWWVPDMSGP